MENTVRPQVSKSLVSKSQFSEVQVRNHAYYDCLSGYTWNPDTNICEGFS